MKILFVILIVQSHLSLLEKSEKKEIKQSLGMDLNKGTLLSTLNELKLKVKQCLYKNGVNQRSFDFCCGEKYSNIENIFESKFRETKLELIDSFSKNVQRSCEFDKRPCYELIKNLDEAVNEDQEIYETMLDKKNSIVTGKSINRTLLELEFDRLKQNYNTYKNAKEMIAQAFIETIHFINEYIQNSPIKIELDIGDYNPENFFEKINYTHRMEEQEEENQENEQKHDFRSGLLKEVIPLQVLLHQISIGEIEKENIDFKQMPSKILKKQEKQQVIINH